MSHDATDDPALRPEDPGGEGCGGSAEAEALGLFARFLTLCEPAAADGEARPDFESWVRGHPGCADELRALHADWGSFDDLLGRALGRAGSSPDRNPGQSPEASPLGAMELAPSRRVGSYRLIERIGHGGMGEVWSAEELPLRRTVALKFIRPDRRSPRSHAYLDREARAGGRLTHPGIVAVHALGGEGELHWIAQELVRGSSTLRGLLDSLHDAERLPRGHYERAARLMAEVCDALQAAHDAGVIHRDVKPQNILIAAGDRPKLSDFGLARLTDESAFSGVYSLKGTPIYMSPEQLLGRSKRIDHRTDVYSTGAVLFELLTRRRPFEGESAEVMRRILESSPPDPRSLCSDVPPDLTAIALKALERDQIDRYQTASEMARDLRRFLAHEPVLARRTSILRRLAKAIRRHPTAAAVLGLGTLLAGVTFGLRAQVQRAAERTEEAVRQVALTRAWQAVEAGDLERAERQLDDFRRRFPGDPRGHLVMAVANASRRRELAVDRELAKVPPDAWEALEDEDWLPYDAEATALLVEALRLRASRGPGADAQAEQLLEQAVELDPRLDVARYHLHLVRKLRGDIQGAIEALAVYRGMLRARDPAVELMDALLEELRGDLSAARERLEALRARWGDQRFAELGGFPPLGRVLLEPGRGHGQDRLREAEEAFGRAVEAVPQDHASWSNLAHVLLLQVRQAASPAHAEELARRAAECARRGIELDPFGCKGLEVAVVAEQELAALVLADQRPELEARLRSALARLEELDPGNPTLRAVRSDLLYAEGMAALIGGDHPLAFERFTQSAEQSELQLPARVMLGQLLYGRGELEAARSQLEDCVRLWPRVAGAGHSPALEFTIYAWLVGAADHSGQLDEALEWRERAYELLDDGTPIAPADAATLAEFLALPGHGELRDCARVQRLFEEHALEETLGAEHGELLASIRAACER